MKISNDHLTRNQYSRPGRKLKDVRAIVLHWVANPGQSARSVRAFFEARKSGGHGYGSAHYIIDGHGVLEVIPPDEVAYHCGSRTYTDYAVARFGPHATGPTDSPNNYTIGIELCHDDWEGSFTDDVWEGAVALVAELIAYHGLSPFAHVTTHNAIVGWKKCPKWMVDHPSELQRFQLDVARAITDSTAKGA